MYYLQSRYYDPELGRFINADAFASTGQGILGNNMFAYCGNNPVTYCDPSGYQFGPTGSQIKATYLLSIGKGGTLLQQYQKEAGNNKIDPQFPVYENIEPCCGGMMHAELLSGSISGPAITDGGLTLISADMSLIRCYLEWDHHRIAIGDMLNASVSADFSGTGASFGAMISAWSPSIMVYTDRGTFTYTLYIGALGIEGMFGYDDKYSLAVAPGGIGFGFSYEK